MIFFMKIINTKSFWNGTSGKTSDKAVFTDSLGPKLSPKLTL